MEQDMLNENPGSSSWKDKLDDIDGLSSLLLQDKNAVWDKLHHRLHQPSKKTNFVWYWLVAACLLVVMIVPLFTANNKTIETAADNTVVHTSASIATNPSTVKESAVILATDINDKKNQVSQPSKSVRQKMAINNSSKKEAPATVLLIEPTPSILSTPVEIQPVQIPFTEKLTTSATPEKKKLKVVHVNELGTPLPELRSRTATDDYSVIQFNFINQRVYNNHPATTSSTRFGSSKSKNISN